MYVSTDISGVSTRENFLNYFNAGDAGQWIHLVVKKEDTTVTVYKNTVATVGSISFQNPASTVRSAKIGVYGTGIMNFFNGTIDEVMIFNQALTEEQINAIYNNQKK